MAVERELGHSDTAPPPAAIFDESGHFLLVPSLLGVKVINTTTNKVVRILGALHSLPYMRFVCHDELVSVMLHRGVQCPGQGFLEVFCWRIWRIWTFFLISGQI